MKKLEVNYTHLNTVVTLNCEI